MRRGLTHVLRQEGALGVVRRGVALAYRRGIRPLLPARGPVLYAGLPIGVTRRVGDAAVPKSWRPPHTDDVPEYEAALVDGLRRHVRAGNRVVVVGGGVGVTAAVAALAAGPGGKVICFEGGQEQAALVRRTAEQNGVADRLEVRHAVVARAVHVYGELPDHAVVAPEQLPECDVLELDCEGAEVDILREMTLRPPVVLVETHGIFGAGSDLVRELLTRAGYRVHDAGVAEPRAAQYCELHDIRVLEATRGAGSEA